MQSYKESEKRRKERIQNAQFLRTRVVESKKLYNRKKLKNRLADDREF